MEPQITWQFLVAGLWTLGAAMAAITLRNLVHCALALAGAFLGLAALYLQLDAQFVGFAQILVYVGAVAILIVFAILLTRGAESDARNIFAGSWFSGVLVSLLTSAVIGGTILSSKAVQRPLPENAPTTVQEIGSKLMSDYLLPLEVLGLLLTAALIGAVIIALSERRAG